MRLDLKIQGKSLKVMKRISSLVKRQGKFDFTKNELFHNSCKDFSHIFESFLISQCLQRGNLNPEKPWKVGVFLTWVNGWNFLPIVAESSTLDVVEVLDMPLVLESYVCD